MVLVCLLATGCGFTAPVAPTAPQSPGPTQSSAAGREVPGAPSVAHRGRRRPGHVDDPWASPLAAEALIAFATDYINWNSHNVAADMRRLATESVGQAHSAMELAAGETARDYELQRGGISNSGKVEGVAPLDGPGRRWVLVTRERTTSTATSSYQGLQPGWHVIVASVVELWPGRWAVSLWQPES